MASTYTSNSGVEKPGIGDQSGEWGTTVNTNMDILDRAINGVGVITLSGTTHTLTTTDGALSEGQYKVLVLSGSPSGTNTITISPNDQDKLYFVVNSSGQTATFSQGSGANVSVVNGDTKIIYADGAGSGAAVTEFASEVDALEGITAGTVAASKAVIVDANKDIGSFRNVDVDGTLEADAMTLNGTAITTTATLSTGISNTNVPVFTTGVADDDFLRVAGTSIEGRSASEVLSDIGGQASLTFGIANTNAVKVDSGSVADDEYARFTADGLESRSTAEVLSDIGGQASLTFGISNTNAVKVDSASVADDEYARFTASGLESRSTSEVLSDIGASPVAGSSSILTTGALDAGSITSGFGAIDNGTSNIRSATITAETAFVPDTSGGADLGSTSLEFNDLFLNDAGSIQLGDDQDVTITHVADTGITLNDKDIAGVTSINTGQIANRNAVQNGAMMVDQKGGTTTLSGYSAAKPDRFTAYVSNAGTQTVAQDSEAPAGFQKSLKATNTVADASIASGDRAAIIYRLEGNDAARFAFGGSDAKTVTISFYVRSSITGTHGGALGNGSDNRAYPFTYAISSADTWERKSITIAGDTTGTWATGTGRSMQIVWGLGVGSTNSGTAGEWAGADYNSATGATTAFLTTANATWYLTGVQLEEGSTATDFEHKSYTQELALCERYYQLVPQVGLAYAGATTTVDTCCPFRTTMRAAPTMSAIAAVTVSNVVDTDYAQSSPNITGSMSVGASSAHVRLGNFSGLTAHDSYLCRNGDMNVAANAEL